MDMQVQATQARGLATEMLAETAFRKMFESMDSAGADGIQGQMQADWLAQTMAGALTGQTGAAGGGPHAG